MVTNAACPFFAAAIKGVSPPTVGHLSSASSAPSVSRTRLEAKIARAVSTWPWHAASVRQLAPSLSVATTFASHSRSTSTAASAPFAAAQISGVAPVSVRHSVPAPRDSRSRNRSASSFNAARSVSGVSDASCLGINGRDLSFPLASSAYGSFGMTFSGPAADHRWGTGHLLVWSNGRASAGSRTRGFVY